jgi:hypothetical protein
MIHPDALFDETWCCPSLYGLDAATEKLLTKEEKERGRIGPGMEQRDRASAKELDLVKVYKRDRESLLNWLKSITTQLGDPQVQRIDREAARRSKRQALNALNQLYSGLKMEQAQRKTGVAPPEYSLLQAEGLVTLKRLEAARTLRRRVKGITDCAADWPPELIVKEDRAFQKSQLYADARLKRVINDKSLRECYQKTKVLRATWPGVNFNTRFTEEHKQMVQLQAGEYSRKQLDWDAERRKAYCDNIWYMLTQSEKRGDKVNENLFKAMSYLFPPEGSAQPEHGTLT